MQKNTYAAQNTRRVIYNVKDKKANLLRTKKSLA